eukprot:767424-Hanusia_phi.AAC.10
MCECLWIAGTLEGYVNILVFHRRHSYLLANSLMSCLTRSVLPSCCRTHIRLEDSSLEAPSAAC